ncbi:CobW family GTP-binding protein [Micromonospora craniellae]|uniref:Cobalamin biosynthesis protein CobW n=1 Tax=Micromonospora craniellae TaxID=2294034 RepID=A0A372FT54_9ACTN|nr:GTP-binding protein [Micromonospora craniellae]QOC92511.1 GTP-binding protein [Micromonospora craniellae]RFS43903.1 cobalamin biosynthesis protein CobW [Micromonospora craniellae]
MSTSSVASAGHAASQRGSRPSLTVLSGFWPAATYAVARTLLATDPGLLLVRHDLADVRNGTVHRVVRDRDGVLEDERISLAHGCVSCTLREDVLPTLARLVGTRPGRDLVLMLPEVVEPEAVAAACAHCLIDGVPITDLLHVDSYVTVVDAEHLLDGLASTDDLKTLSIHAADNDDRALADVIVRQIEYADTLVLWGHSAEGAYDTDRLAVLLNRITPWAAQVRVDDDLVDANLLTRQLRDTHRYRPETPGVLARGLEGHLVGVHEPQPDCGIVSAVFRARRPFHPQRLHDVLEELTAEVIRSRGHLWLASQPETVVAWDFAGGGLALGSLGRWLAALPDRYWDEVSDHRRLAAAMDWDPYYGDRHQHLVFIGLDLDPTGLHGTLTRCLLTDAELADGEQAWRDYRDPFTDCFPLPALDDEATRGEPE